MSSLLLAGVCSGALLSLCALAGRLKFLAAEFRSISRRLVALLLLIGILAVVVFYPVTSGGRTDVDVDDLWFPALFAGHALLVAFLVLWRVLSSPSLPIPVPTLRLGDVVADVWHGVAVGLSGWLITIAVTVCVAGAALASGVGPEPPTQIPATMVWLAEMPLSHKLMVIVAAMTVEEWFFRGFLQRRIGLLLSSVLFALAHAGYGLPFMMVSVLTISLLIGRALRQRGRLLPCIVAHGVFDAIQLLVIMPWAVHMMTGEITS